MSIYSLTDQSPIIDKSAYIAPSAQVIGQVRIGARSSFWFNSVARGETAPITIGEETNIQDLSMCHADPGKPLTVGNRVTVGHRCIIHGCIIENECLIGMGAIIMNEARIGRGSVVAAGSVVLENVTIPPFSLVAGAPAKVKKTYDEHVLEKIHRLAQVYVDRAQSYIDGLESLLTQVT